MTCTAQSLASLSVCSCCRTEHTYLYIQCPACILLQKDGKQLPGKKGISLPADQFQKLLEAQASLTEALAGGDTGLEVALSGKYVACTSSPACMLAWAYLQIDALLWMHRCRYACRAHIWVALHDHKKKDSTGKQCCNVLSTAQVTECMCWLQVHACSKLVYGSSIRMLPNTRPWAGRSNSKSRAATAYLSPCCRLPQLRCESHSFDVKLVSSHHTCTPCWAVGMPGTIRSIQSVRWVCRRKATISEFKGKLMVNIREYYEKDGQEKPGAKGISLPPEQWHKLAAGLGTLDAALKEQTT